MTSLAKTSSWVIKEKATGRVIFETFNAALIDKIKPEYEAIPILEHLQSLNKAQPL